MGVLEEVRNQQVYVGDNIKQYAIIQFIDSGATYKDLCPDCTCTITVSNNADGVIITDDPTTELSQGLFSYKTTTTYFNPSQSYFAVFNCTSGTYGSGLAHSQVDILDKPPLSSGLKPMLDTPASIEPQGLLGDMLNQLIGGGAGDIIEGIIDGVEDPIATLLGLPTAIVTLYNGLIDIIVNFSLLFGQFIGIIFLMFKSPSLGFKALINLFWEILKPLITLVAVPIVLYEFYIISFKAMPQPIDQMFKTILDAQITIIMTFKKIIDTMLEYLMMIINLTLNIIKTIGSLTPGT